MIIGVCGLGYTGSGAVFDLIREYDTVQVQKGGEFWLSYRPDGLEDLIYHLNNPSRFTSSDVAILRYKELVKRLFMYPKSWGINSSDPILRLTDEYIRSFTQVQWKGFWSYDVINASKLSFLIKWRIFRKFYDKYPYLMQSIALKFINRDMYLSVNPERIVEKTSEYVSNLFKLLGYDDSGLLLLDQPFSGDFPSKSFPFFNNPKAIIVDKDPRDLFVLCKKEIITDCRWTPTDDVDSFIKYYKLIRKDIEQSDTILYVRFEDLIFEYDKTVKRIERFIGLSEESHINKLQFFNPEISKNNTQIFKKYKELFNSITLIEQELPEYLYPFEHYPEVIHNGNSF